MSSLYFGLVVVAVTENDKWFLCIVNIDYLLAKVIEEMSSLYIFGPMCSAPLRLESNELVTQPLWNIGTSEKCAPCKILRLSTHISEHIEPKIQWRHLFDDLATNNLANVKGL